MRIAVPENKLFSKFTNNLISISEKNDIQIITASEKRCTELLHSNRVDIALLSPLGYGLGVNNVDYRIIPGPALATHGFTSIASIFFKPGLKNVTSCIAENPDDFIMIIGRLILEEKFDLLLNIGQNKGSVEELLKIADSAMAWQRHTPGDVSLDISDEWFDTYEMPLPLMFWVCHYDDTTEDYFRLIRSLFSTDNEFEELVIDDERISEDYIRSGKLTWVWDNDFEDALAETLSFLYFHQLLPEIPAIKLLGRD